MAPKIRNFHEKLEADIKRLVVQERGQEHRPGAPERSGRELLRETLEAYAERVAPAPVAAPSPAPVTSAATPLGGVGKASVGALADLAGGGAVPAKVELEVERLLDLVFDKGLEVGIREARKHSPFVQDAFHDTLVDKLLPELEKRGIIK